MICPRPHSSAGQTAPWPLPAAFSLILLGLVLLGPGHSASGLQPLEIHAVPCLPAAHGEAGKGPFRDAVAEGEGGSLGLESAPTGTVGPP